MAAGAESTKIAATSRFAATLTAAVPPMLAPTSTGCSTPRVAR